MQVHTYRFGWPTRLAGLVCAYTHTCNTSLSVCVSSQSVSWNHQCICLRLELNSYSSGKSSCSLRLFLMWLFGVGKCLTDLKHWKLEMTFISVSYKSAGIICAVVCGAVKVFLPSYINDFFHTVMISTQTCFLLLELCWLWRSCGVTAVCEECWALYTHWEVHLETKQTIMDTRVVDFSSQFYKNICF